MKKLYLLIPILIALASSCQRDPIQGEVSKYRIEFTFDEDILYLKPNRPQLIQFTLYDSQTGKKMKGNNDIPMSPEGAYFVLEKPGIYDIVAVSMSSSSVKLSRTDDISVMTLLTNNISGSNKTIQMPDHYYIGAAKRIEFPHLTESDAPFVYKLPLRSVSDSWMIEIHGLKGLEYLNSLEIRIGSQSEYLSVSDMMPKGNATVLVNRNYKSENGILYIPFCTFGMPEKGEVNLKIALKAQDGYIHTLNTDASEQVFDPGNKSHIIRLEMDAELKPLEQGGLDPRSEEWNENWEHIRIE